MGESHQASRRDVWANLPFFKITSGADTSSSTAEGFEDDTATADGIAFL